MAAHRRIDVVLDSVKRLQRIGASANLLNLLQKQRPADLAEVFGELPDKDSRGALNLLLDHNSRLAMEALIEYGPEHGVALLADHAPDKIAIWLQELPSDDAVALIDELPDDVSASVIELMRRQESGEVENLLEYAEETAGRIMNPTVFALSEDQTAGEAIQALQGSREVEMVFYLYVVDERRHLVGVVSLRRLLLVAPETPLQRIMTTDLISARVDTDQEEVAQHVANYNLLAIPVVDEENKLAGIITVDDVIDIIKDEATRGHLPAGRGEWRRARVYAGARVGAEAVAVAGGQPGHRNTGRLRGAVVPSHHRRGRGAGGVHDHRRQHGRQRGDPGADGHRPGYRPWES